jgi:hypothetical protein
LPNRREIDEVAAVFDGKDHSAANILVIGHDAVGIDHAPGKAI